MSHKTHGGHARVRHNSEVVAAWLGGDGIPGIDGRTGGEMARYRTAEDAEPSDGPAGRVRGRDAAAYGVAERQRCGNAAAHGGIRFGGLQAIWSVSEADRAV